MSRNDHRHRRQDPAASIQPESAKQSDVVGETEGRHWTSLNCRFDHTLILMNCKSRAEAFARNLQTKLKSLGRSSVEDDADNDVDGGGDDDDAVLGKSSECSPSSSSSRAATALSKLSLLSTNHSTSSPVVAEHTQLIQSQRDERIRLNSSFGEDELYFDFGYSSPESPVTDGHNNHHDGDTSTIKPWERPHECQHTDGLVTEQPRSSNGGGGSFKCGPCAAMPWTATSTEALEGESGCISAVSSVLADQDDDYTSELDDEDDEDCLSMMVLDEDFETTVLSWPSAPTIETRIGCGPESPSSSSDRLTPITEQLTLEEVEIAFDREPATEVYDVDLIPENDGTTSVIDDDGADNSSMVPLIMTSAHSPENSTSHEQVLNDISKLHVNVGLQTPSNSLDDIESELISPTPSDDNFPQRVQRSSSLKSGKTPPGTPNRKKIVRFADALGLDLEAVKTVFLDDLPTVPSSAYDDLSESVLLANNNESSATAINSESRFGWPRTLLVPLFEQPGCLTDFLDRVRRQSVCLESAVAISGLQLVLVVRVLNLDYHKSVTVRYSLNDWLTYDDVGAEYVKGSCDGFSDKFQVTLNVNHLMSHQRLAFALRYSTGGSADVGRVFWDNNGGHDYAFRCIVETDCHRLPTSTLPPDESWIHFL